MSRHDRPRGGRPTRPRARRIAGRRAAAVLASVLTLTMMAGSLYAYARYREVWDSIDRVNVLGDLGNRPPADPHAVNVLLIGSDSRAGQNGVIGGRDGIAGQRSDTVMVLHIAPGARRAAVLSFPRDSVVPVLACQAEDGTAGQSAQPGEMEQLNSTFAYGGPGCLWRTIEKTTHIYINDFVELTFSGFEKVIDDLGGVSVCLPAAVDDPMSGLHLSAGRHHIYGSQALAFWRTREDLGEGSDTQRIQRDQFLMAALLQGIEKSGLLTSTSKLAAVIGDAARQISVDSQLTQVRMLQIAASMRGLTAGSVQFIEVPWQAYPENTDWVQWTPQASALFAAVAYDTRLPPAAGQASAARARAAGRRRANADKPATSASAAPAGLAGTYGGITGNVSICRDGGAFAGPDGS